jgi:hypothetical protein
MAHSGIVGSLYAGTFAVEISTNGTNWTAVSDATVKVDDVEMTRISGEAYVGGSSDYSTVTIGKREPVEITLTILYNEDTNSAANTIYDQFESRDAAPGRPLVAARAGRRRAGVCNQQRRDGYGAGGDDKRDAERAGCV